MDRCKACGDWREKLETRQFSISSGGGEVVVAYKFKNPALYETPVVKAWLDRMETEIEQLLRNARQGKAEAPQ